MVAADFDYQAVRNDIISRALRIVGAMSFGDTLTADHISQCSTALNQMVKAWQLKDVFLWTLVSNTLTLAAATESYATPTATPIIGVEQAYFVDGTRDRELDVISYRQYQEIPDKADAGEPTHICFVKTEPPTFLVWPVPDAIGSIKYLAVTKGQDFDDENDTGGFPSAWGEALSYGLAARICDEFILPLGERKHLEGKAETAFFEAKNGNVEQGTDNCVESLY